MSIAVGQLVNEQYEVLSLVGRGLRGEVYRVRQRGTGKCWLLKTLLVGEEFLQRFWQEAPTLRKLDHPNIVRFIDCDLAQSGQLYLVLEDAAGRDLEDFMQEHGQLPINQCMALFEQICDALGFAHHVGVLHRNLKPSQIIVVSQSPLKIKIMDLGLAAILNCDLQDVYNLNKPGASPGSPYYVSPEQCMGRQSDVRADIYAFGCLMYRVLTGRRPFDGDKPADILLRHIHDQPTAFRYACADRSISEELEKIVFKCLEKSPEDRFSSVSELKRALENFKEKGTAGSAVSGVTIPSQNVQKASPAKSAAPATVSAQRREQTHGADSASGKDEFGTASQKHPGTVTASKLRPQPQQETAPERPGARPMPLLIGALLAIAAIAATILYKPEPARQAVENPSPAVSSQPISPVEAGSLSSAELSRSIYSKLPGDARQLLEHDDALEAQSGSGGIDWVMNARITPAVAAVEKTFGAESLESVWFRSRVADLLLLGAYFPQAEDKYRSSLEMQRQKFDSKPGWLIERTRAGHIASLLAIGEPDKASVEMLKRLAGEGELRAPVDRQYRNVLSLLQKNSKSLNEAVTTTELADMVLEENLKAIIASAEAVPSRNFELKTFAYWYLLMIKLNARDNDQPVRAALAQLNELTKPVTAANEPVGYLMILAAEKARSARRPGLAREIDQMALSRLNLQDETDPLYLHYKALYPEGIAGLAPAGLKPPTGRDAESNGP